MSTSNSCCSTWSSRLAWVSGASACLGLGSTIGDVEADNQGWNWAAVSFLGLAIILGCASRCLVQSNERSYSQGTADLEAANGLLALARQQLAQSQQEKASLQETIEKNTEQRELAVQSEQKTFTAQNQALEAAAEQGRLNAAEATRLALTATQFNAIAENTKSNQATAIATNNNLAAQVTTLGTVGDRVNEQLTQVSTQLSLIQPTSEQTRQMLASLTEQISRCVAAGETRFAELTVALSRLQELIGEIITRLTDQESISERQSSRISSLEQGKATLLQTIIELKQQLSAFTAEVNNMTQDNPLTPSFHV